MKRKLVKLGTIVCAGLAMLVLAGHMLLSAMLTRLAEGSFDVGESMSYGIIGGADGPAAIFVTARPVLASPLVWAGVLTALAVAGFFWLRRIDRR